MNLPMPESSSNTPESQSARTTAFWFTHFNFGYSGRVTMPQPTIPLPIFPETCVMNDSRAVPVRPRLLLRIVAGISLSLLTCFPFLMPREEIAAAMQEPPFPGQIGEWQGFRRYDFEISGNAVVVVAPQQAAPGNPWVWHGEFFGHKPAPDIALLQRGFHVVYLRVPDLLGCPTAVEHWNACYRVLTEQHGLASKVGLVGLSRGGLYCYNWAAANPEKVACIYGDAPVCDFKSWPGGRGSGKGSPRDWQLVLDRYGFKNDTEALAYTKNPVDNLEALARANVPLLHIYGDADEVVPWDENTGLLAERYRKLGGNIQLIVKPGVGHHPHGLDDPRPIVDFFLTHAAPNPPDPRKKNNPDVVDLLAEKIEPSRLIVYKKIQQRELYLHMLEPEGWQATDKRPCFIIIHGGGWTGGQPQRMYPFADHYRRQGMVGISVQYRLLDKERNQTVFDCVKDGRSAVRFVRSHAEILGIDPGRIIVCGGSAGGHVAAGTALFEGVDEEGESTEISSVPQALVLLFPVIDTSAAGYGNAKIGENWRTLSPLHNVHAGVPPCILFHGTGDTVTPFSGAQAFQEAMHAAGNRCELIAHPDGKHGYLMSDRPVYLKTLQQADEFLKSLDLLP